VLTIDLEAVRWNYRFLRSKLGAHVRCGAMVKADAYGLGAEYVAPALHAEGCPDFFVAHLDEGLRLRPHLPASSIFILNGLPSGGEADCADAGLVPVLNSLDQCHAWSMHAQSLGETLPAVVQVDSGMNRLGMSQREITGWVKAGSRTAGVDVQFVMSHLACADAQSHVANAMQLARFRRLADHFPGLPRPFANSSGIFLGKDFHHGCRAAGGVALRHQPGSGAGQSDARGGSALGAGHSDPRSRQRRSRRLRLGFSRERTIATGHAVHRLCCVCRKLDSAILMVKAAKDRS
jgi:alanine racemase